jgi:RNA polymerase sigma-70 factor (ECF subfamily)
VVGSLFGRPRWTAGSGQDDFSVVLIALLPRLRRYATALVGDPNLADDLVQDCLERALRNRAALKEEARAFGWLRSILHNLYMDDLRYRRRRGIVADVDDLANSLAQSVPPADRNVAIDFVRAMNRLSVDHRQILLLVGMEGLSYREAAAELNLPIGTVMSRLARAREHLRELLEDQGPPLSPSKHPGGGPADQ